MQHVKSILKQIPGVRSAYQFAAGRYASLRLKWMTPEHVFAEIFRGNKWDGTDSVSGPGSDVFQTRVVRSELPAMCRSLSIHTMLDIPCGDFHWMKTVDLQGIDYIGGDIVPDLIRSNSRYETSNVHFRKLNLIDDNLPQVDLIFCRDCLVHFSFKDTFTALKHICSSRSTYLLTTTFTSRNCNRDIPTGQWRTLNFEVSPFSFPQPLITINEGCTEGRNMEFKDKSLGLWRVDDIRECLAQKGDGNWMESESRNEDTPCRAAGNVEITIK